MLLALAAASALDAERAFAATAQRDGQWTAFRAYAAPDAVMFVPGAVNAQDWLKGRADPPRAVMWWPGAGWVSCDGRVAVNTGPWVRDGGRLRGYFTTVWRRQPDGGWRWVLDAGDALAVPRPAGDTVRVRRARCGTRAAAPGIGAEGASPDGTLRWGWRVGADGARRIVVTIAGAAAPVIDETAAP